MKLSRTSWLLITIGFFVTAFASLGAIGSQQIHQRSDLSEELDSIETKLNGFKLDEASYQQEEVDAQLEQILSELETSKAIFSEPGWNIITDTLFDIAETCGVEITVISSSRQNNNDLEGVPCSLQTLTININGSVANIVSFITTLNRNLDTGVIESLSISIPETDSEEIPSANIQFVIYTYQGD